MSEIMDKLLGEIIGNLLVGMAERAVRRGDWHEFRHIRAAVVSGNSEGCTDDFCTLEEKS